MTSSFTIISRGISTSCICNGKRNFRKIDLSNKRGSRAFKEARRLNPDPALPIDKRGVKDVGYTINGKFVTIPEKIPEIIVPNLENFPLKPYVSYRAEEFVQRPEFTAKELFVAVYAKKIKEDYDKGELTPEGEPLNPSREEKLTPEEARNLAEKTGTDLFEMEKPQTE